LKLPTAAVLDKSGHSSMATSLKVANERLGLLVLKTSLYLPTVGLVEIFKVI